MASHQLAIAKASLSAALLRPDPTSVNKQELSGFLTLLDEAVLKCSPANVQSCKRWLLKNVILSNARLTALGKYFVALSGSWKSGGSSISTPLTPSNKRRRLHVLYILFDTLYHLRHFSDRDVSASYATKRDVLQRALTELFALAASFESCPKHHQKLQTLLDIWEQKALDDAEHIQSYRNVVEEPTKIKSILDSLDASSASQNGSGSTNGAEILWDMPRSHGDSSTPWYDLPAANMMHLIDSERPGPIHPRDMKPLKFNPGPADPELVEAVKDFLQDVDRMYQSQPPEDEGIVIDIDPMGQSIVKDLVSGERRESESYYGWSTEFCEKMKRKKRGLPISTDRGRGRSKDRFSNPDRSSDIIRKRRRSFSSESRSRGRYSSSSRSRSRQRYQRKDSRRRQYSSSSKSPSPLRDGRSSPGYYRDRRDSRSASPPPRHHDSHNFSPSTVALPSTGSGIPSGNNFVPPPFPFLSQQGSPPPPFPPPFSTAGSSGFPPPPPPPPPPNYSGPWPPPPPPPSFACPQRQMSQMQGVPQFGYPTPPPPPPPPPQQYGGSTDASMDPRLQRKGNGSAGYR